MTSQLAFLLFSWNLSRVSRGMIASLRNNNNNNNNASGSTRRKTRVLHSELMTRVFRKMMKTVLNSIGGAIQGAPPPLSKLEWKFWWKPPESSFWVFVEDAGRGIAWFFFSLQCFTDCLKSYLFVYSVARSSSLLTLKVGFADVPITQSI